MNETIQTIPGLATYDYAMFAYFAAYLAYAAHTLLFRSVATGRVATGLLLVAFGLHTWFFVERALFYHEQHGGFLMPATNMFEAISYFAWLVVLLYLVSEQILKTRAFGLFALIVPAVALAYGSRAMTPDPRELFPSLKSYWLVFHISAMFISYALFFLAFVFGLMYVLRAWGVKAISWLDSRYNLSWLDALSARFIMIGVPVLSLGIGLGAVWANAAWGRPWAWDPKETWALITWFVYIIYLHFRSYGWFNGYRAALGSIVGFVAVLITFQGVNLLDSLFDTNSIHAYAEGGNPIAVLAVLTALLLIPIILLFVPMPAAAIEHARRRREETEAVERADETLPQRLGGGGKDRESVQPLNRHRSDGEEVS